MVPSAEVPFGSWLPNTASVLPFAMATNITFHDGHVTYDERCTLLGQQGATLWLTGLSASGKSTIATALEQHLLHQNISAFRLDGDNIRFGLNKDLGFSPKDREENIRRIAEVSGERVLKWCLCGESRWADPRTAQVSLLFSSSTAVTITSFISPYKADRDLARKLHAEAKPALPFIEVFIDASVEECEKRDPKGLYKKARAGEIKGGFGTGGPALETRLTRIPLPAEFTGISAPYEAPSQPEIHIDAGSTSITDSVKIITDYLLEKGIVKHKS